MAIFATCVVAFLLALGCSTIQTECEEGQCRGADHTFLLQATRSPGGSNIKLAEDPDNFERLKNIMKEASNEHVTGAANVLHKLEKGKLGKADADKVLEQYSADILSAVEEVSMSTEVDTAAKFNEVVTSEMLVKLQGLDKSPEQVAKSTESVCVVEGDMKAHGACHTSFLEAAVAAGQQWAGVLFKKPIKYCFANSTVERSKKAMKHAFAHITAHVPCVTFSEVAPTIRDGNMPACVGADEAIYITSVETGSCSSYVGAPDVKKFPGTYVTEMNIAAYSCDVLGVAVHEVGHALGMLHEQARKDYSTYVTINWANIEAGGKSQFETDSNGDRTVPYDIQSVMHYPGTMFGIYNNDGTQKTVMTKTAHSSNTGKVMGNRMGLTRADALQLGKMYGCESQVPNFELCSGAGGCSSNANCKCHQDPTAGAAKVIKANPSTNCYQCVVRCPNSVGGGYDGSPECGGCPATCKLKNTVSDGSTYKSCVSASSPSTTCGVAE